MLHAQLRQLRPYVCQMVQNRSDDGTRARGGEVVRWGEVWVFLQSRGWVFIIGGSMRSGGHPQVHPHLVYRLQDKNARVKMKWAKG